MFGLNHTPRSDLDTVLHGVNFAQNESSLPTQPGSFFVGLGLDGERHGLRDCHVCNTWCVIRRTSMNDRYSCVLGISSTRATALVSSDRPSKRSVVVMKKMLFSRLVTYVHCRKMIWRNLHDDEASALGEHRSIVPSIPCDFRAGVAIDINSPAHRSVKIWPSQPMTTFGKSYVPCPTQRTFAVLDAPYTLGIVSSGGENTGSYHSQSS